METIVILCRKYCPSPNVVLQLRLRIASSLALQPTLIAAPSINVHLQFLLLSSARRSCYQPTTSSYRNPLQANRSRRSKSTPEPSNRTNSSCRPPSSLAFHPPQRRNERKPHLARRLLRTMGSVNSTGSKLEKALATDLPDDERYFGLENFGNTCYCNSVLQALYFCEPFRRAVLDYAHRRRSKTAQSELSDRPPSSAPSGLISSFLSSSSSSAPSSSSSTAPTSNPASNGGSGIKSTLKSVVPSFVTSHATTSNTTTNSAGSTSSSAGNGSTSGPSAPNSEIERPLSDDDTMLTALADLFYCIASQKKRTGSVPPKSFVNKLRQENELFSTYMHQDAHEFLNFILNNIVECLNREAALNRKRALPPRDGLHSVGSNSTTVHIANGKIAHNGSLYSQYGDVESSKSGSPAQMKTFVHDLFEGQLSNEVRCLCCETVTRRVESFFDLSVDVEQNSSLTSCLRSFSSTELLEKQDKFFCDACCSLQEAERRMRVKQLPRILALHLKRFKYVEQLGKYKKLSYRVVFPLELRLCNTSDDAEDPDRLYSLFAVIVHVGSGPNQGHYVSLIKSHDQWLLFDDDCVEPKDESEIQSVYGVTQDSAQSTEAGYILFYEQTSSYE